MLEHDATGALGLVLNRPSDHPLADAVRDWTLHTAEPRIVFEGGPVQPEAAFCIAIVGRASPEVAGWRPIVGRLGIADLETDPFDIEVGVESSRVFSGYAGWSGGQLERELRDDAWFVVDADLQDPVTPEPDTLWVRVLRRQPGPLAWVAHFPDDPNDN